MGAARLSAMCPWGAVLLLLAAWAALARAEDNSEMLRAGERALCAASHSKAARSVLTGRGTGFAAKPGSASGAGFNAFLVFNVRPCSGAVVSEYHLLTSAYCTEHSDNGTAFLGGRKYQSVQDLKQPEVMIALVSEVHHYEHSEDQHLDHDIAVVRLNRKLNINGFIKLATITPLNAWTDPQPGVMMGYGETFEGDYAHELRSAMVQLECGPMCSEDVPTYRLGSNALCTETNGTFSMCWGDMGGATIDGEGNLVGLIAYKTLTRPTLRQCSVSATHTFFMFLGYYRDWINSITSAGES